MGNKVLVNFRVDTKDIPADDSSRDAPLRSPMDPPSWAIDLLIPEDTPMPDAELLIWDLRSVVEAYAGKAGLSRSLHEEGLMVESPLEAFPSKCQYVAWNDMKNPRAIFRLRHKIISRTLKYIHFGIYLMGEHGKVERRDPTEGTAL